jgi:hypothetical protein
MFLSEQDKECLGKLECGTGIVKLAGRIFEPFCVKFPLMNIKKGSITDSQVVEHMARKGFSGKQSLHPMPISQAEKMSIISGIIKTAFDDLKKSQGYPAQNGNNLSIISESDKIKNLSSDEEIKKEERIGSFSGNPAADNVAQADLKISHTFPTKDEIDKMTIWLKEKWAESGDEVNAGMKSDDCSSNKTSMHDCVLSDIKLHPFDGIAMRSKRLKISHRKCSDGIAHLESKGVLKKVEIKEKSGRRVLFEISGFDYSLGGIEHRYWNHCIAKINRDSGYKVEIEKKIEGDGYIDQVISKGDIKIAIEIETGKSTPYETIVRDLELGFSRVISVAINEQAYFAIKQNISKAGLSDDSRISLVTAQEYSQEFL